MLRTVLASLALLAFAPSGAHASVAFLGQVGETAAAQAHGDPGERNDMTARAGGDGVIFTDTAGIRPLEDRGCRSLSPTEVTCLSEGSGILFGEDGDDTLRDAGATGPGFGARGGPGNDTIFGGAIPAILYGDDSRVLPTDGNDRIAGSSAAQPGGSASGRIWDDDINGGGGNDVIDAGPGADHASGQAGNDTVKGGDGPDSLESSTLLTQDERDAPGDAGNDNLSGDAGDDIVLAARGSDRASGGTGNDWLRASDYEGLFDDKTSDLLNCGLGADRVSAAGGDRIVLGCEALLVLMYCLPRYPCLVNGVLTGHPRGSGVNRGVARTVRSISSPTDVRFTLGRSATALLSSRTSAFLVLDMRARRGRAFAGGRFFSLILQKA